MINADQSSHSPATTSAGPDLSKAIDQSLDHSPNEELRSVRVFGDWYRCNWWLNSRHDWLGVAARRISRSRFLRVVQDGQSLLVRSSDEIDPRRIQLADKP